MFEQRAEVIAKGRVIEEFGDGILSVSDPGEIGEWGGDPFSEESGAHGSAVVVEDSEEGKVAAVVADGLSEFEASACGFVDDHVPLAAEVFESEYVREGGARSFPDVFEESAGGSDGGGVIDVEAFERFGAEMFVEEATAFIAGEAPVGAGGEDDGEPVVAAFVEGAVLGGGFGDNAFGGADAGELIGELCRFDIGEEEASGGEFKPCKSQSGFGGCQACEEVALARVEHLVVGKRSRRDDSSDFPTDEPFGFFGVFNLIADGGSESGLNEFLEVGVELVIWEPGHWDGVFGVFVATGERESEDAGCVLGVFEEEFVEVAHAKEEHGAGMFRLHSVIAFHHGREFGHGGSSGGVLSVSERFHIGEEHTDAGAAMYGVNGLGEERCDGDDFKAGAEWFDGGFDGIRHKHALDVAVFDAGNGAAGENAVRDGGVDFECSAGFQDFGHAHE